MATEKKIYIALAILVVLGGLIFWQSKKSKEHAASHAPTTASASLPTIKLPEDDVDKVTKLVLKDKDKDEVVLEKRGDKWWLTKPVEAVASQQNIKSTLDNLKAIEVKDAINDTADAPKMYKEYDLEGDKAVHVTAFKGEKGAEKVFDAYFGKSGSRGQMARVEDKPGIWVVKGYSSFQYTRQPKDWREKSLLKFEDKNVVSVLIQNQEGELSFSMNDDKWAATFDKKKIEKFDEDKIKDMLRAYRNLNAENFATKEEVIKKTRDNAFDKMQKELASAFKVHEGDDAPDAEALEKLGKHVEITKTGDDAIVVKAKDAGSAGKLGADFQKKFPQMTVSKEGNDFTFKVNPDALFSEALITIVLKDDAGTHKIHFGGTSSGSSRYAKKEGDETIYVIGSWASDWAVAKQDKFEKKEGDKDDKKKPPTGMPPMPGGMPGMPMPPMDMEED